MIDFLNRLNGMLWGLPLIVLMLAAGLYFTLRSGFFQFRYFGFILKRTLGRLSERGNGDEKGTLSPFETICTAVGGTVGFGNIAGVATAVAAGGPGAVFWMWLTACLGMILKQVEVTLGCYYRGTNDKGETYGGPTYYMEKGLGEERGWGRWWKIPASVFGIGIFSTFFVTSAALTTSEVVAGAFKLDGIRLGALVIEGEIMVALVLAALTFVITSGGTKGVAAALSGLVPLMSAVYILMGLAMILVNLSRVPEALGMIFKGAFTGHAAVGGFAGAAVSGMIQTGMARSVYSNEAGWGTSPMVHISLPMNSQKRTDFRP